MITFELPWPSRACWQNSRSHWAVKAQAVSNDRHTALVLTLKALNGKQIPVPPNGESLKVHLIFNQPNRTPRYDLANAEAACKAFLDGIADATAIDDEQFYVDSERGPKSDGAGSVTVSVGE